MAASAADIAKRWVQNTAASTGRYTEGVNAVQVAPGEQAAAASDRWRNGVNRAAADGSFERGCRSVSLSDWKKVTVEKGAARLATGAQAAAPKMERFMRAFLPLQEQMSAQIAAMPRGTVADSIARSTAAIQFNAALKGKLSGS